ncbi:M23 family peptidase [Rhodopseudomonas palustris]|uniref:M23 family peptidase n=1 Tax=Rhodopseudomonas palustris TaxID=1076 RepID=UPI002ACE6A71|nr:M23 family peptidase [Rhodopseudomonas palustris]WQH01969.1 M23 family peptidase [Rhodopseudomonas palustris]
MRGLPALLIAALAAATPARADDFRTPTVTTLRTDWSAALSQLRSELGGRPAVAAEFIFSGRRGLRAYDPRRIPALVRLNAISARFFPGIGRSAVPVLLPFDVAALLDADPKAEPDQALLLRVQAGFRPVEMFDAGPSGYDAVFALEPGAGDDMPPRVFASPVEVQITGSNLIYDIADPFGGKGEPVKALAAQYPDLRRFIREGHVRYAFTRFGVAYVVSIQCLDSVPKARRLACRESYPVAERFLTALRIAGGRPHRPRRDIEPAIAERPTALSPDFSYRPSGDIIANSGFRKQQGRPDFTVYAQMRFPIENQPAYARSQSYARHRPAVGGNGPYAYPWRDNFCESRSFGVGQCATGFGHQGQDIRPGACLPGQADCDVKQQGVVAVRDGVLIRSPKQQAVTLQVNTSREHIRFRYMHMNPWELDADGVLNGRRVDEGERFGVVGNYLDRPNGTSRHLHFDVQVFTPDGWLWVNPYVTLIAAYERLLGERGSEIVPEAAFPPAVARAGPEE